MQIIEDIRAKYGAAFDLVVKAATSKLSTPDIVHALEEFAKGNDGVLGTPDDTIDSNTLNILTDLIESGLAEKIVTFARTFGQGSETGESPAPPRTSWASWVSRIFTCFGRA